MNKHFLFLSNMPIAKKPFEACLRSCQIDLSSLAYFSPYEGELILKKEEYSKFDSLMPLLKEHLEGSLAFLCCHDRGELSKKLLKDAVAYFPSQAVFPTDVLMKEMSFADYTSIPLLSSSFSSLDPELLLTAGTYLRCGLDASLAAKALFIHRNTFNYRLSAFIEKTGLDIRDYHNALLLEIYFQLSAGRYNARG